MGYDFPKRERKTKQKKEAKFYCNPVVKEIKKMEVTTHSIWGLIRNLGYKQKLCKKEFWAYREEKLLHTKIQEQNLGVNSLLRQGSHVCLRKHLAETVAKVPFCGAARTAHSH